MGGDWDLTNDDEMIGYAVPAVLDRRTHRARRDGRASPAPRRTRAVPAALREQMEGEDDFTPAHACSENEEAMLRDALGAFYRDNLITDVLARVKGGKEANVYCCQAHPSTGFDLVAAKIYRPRAHRTMRNDALYKEGRLLFDKQGKGIVRDSRYMRAVARKTDFGRELMSFSWIEHEVDMLRTLHASGADVPRPIAHAGNAILMEYLGELNAPAPTLSGVHLDSRAEAARILDRLLWHVALMLAHNRVHGDLSAYNVLYWADRAVLIDFPQAVVATRNANAEWLLQRDLARLAQYFARYDLVLDAATVGRDLWQRFMDATL